jgi:sugar lactone lactonase YvrE
MRPLHRRVLFLLSMLLPPALLRAAPLAAVRELGQPDFTHFLPNRVDGRGLAIPSAVAFDRSRDPNGIWVLDTNNNRVLGWRDLGRAASGALADVVLGQPDALSSGCNTGGISARSLCFVYTFYTTADIPNPGLAVDAEGNLWVADQTNYRVLGYRRPFATDAVADVVIGQADFEHVVKPWFLDAQGKGITVGGGLATDAAGNLFVADIVRVIELDRPFATDTRIDRVYGQSSVDTFDTFDSTEAESPARVPFPDALAVDGAGRLYVTDRWSDRVLIWEEPLALPGGAGPADRVLAQGGPHCSWNACSNQKGIAVEADGDLWVGDAALGKVFGYRAPYAAGNDDVPDATITAFNTAPVPGQPYDPHLATQGEPLLAGGRLAVDAADALWIVDVERVLGFSAPWSGQTTANRVVGQVRLDEIGINLVDADGFAEPAALALDTSVTPPHLYVLDVSNQRVLGWADAETFANGRPADLVLGQQDRWSTGCNKGGRSMASLCPSGRYSGMAVDAHGTLWVADAGNNRVLGYRAPFEQDRVADVVLGQPDGGTGACALSASGLCLPGGVAVDRDGNVYVADIAQNRILEYNDPLHRGGVADAVLGSANMRRNRCTDPATCFSEQNGSHPGLDVSGGPLAIDRGGRLLVGNGDTIFVFARPRKAGARSRRLVGLPGSYFAPLGLATDSSGRIYVTAGKAVRRFRSDGAGPDLEVGECTVSDTTGLPIGFGPASLCAATGVAVSPGGELFVADAAARRVVVYDVP